MFLFLMLRALKTSSKDVPWFLHPTGSSFTVPPQVFPVNPKSMSLGELYGEYDLATNEWTDGVLSSIMRAACAGERFISFTCVCTSIID